MDTAQHISKATLKFLKTLSQKKARHEEGLFIVEGWRSIEEACTSTLSIPVFLFTQEAKAHAQFAPVFALARTRAEASYEVTDRELSAITETVTTQGAAVIARQFSYSLHDELTALRTTSAGLIVALDRIAEPGNLGAIIRTADWFGAGVVLLSEESVEVYNPKVVRSTMGSLFHLPVIELPLRTHTGQGVETLADALGACRDAGYALYGADVHGAADLRTVRFAEKSAIVFGNEARGLSPEVSAMLDERVMIPKFGKAESLNAAAAAAVILASIRLR